MDAQRKEDAAVTGSFGLNALFMILISVLCIGLSWWALQAFRFDLFVKKPDGPQAKALQILLSIFIGHGVAQFLLDYYGSSRMLEQLFR
ncbi:DUF1146 family protein [Brevibacillus dissolubilis]|uniref:DUF1146 family protein n=1 Tax=Brevibacillus dissolubilis TaxID=1844116 RepID=UPI0011171AB1|nr:DUF1146 family protein [Brevibacillus dissolubilis]